MGGFFKMPKSAFDDLFDNVLEYRLLTLILRNAVYQDEGVMIENIHVKRGQWIRSYRKLSEDLKYKEGRGYKQYSPPAILKAMKRLEKKGYIKISLVQLTDRLTGKLTDRLTLIEVVEHQEYQGVSDDQKTDQLTDRLTDELTDKATKIKNLKELKKKDIDQPSGRSSESYNDEFEKFWSIYPRKVGKKKAFSHWKARIKSKDPETRVSAEDLLKAVQNYAKQCEADGTESRYIKHPSTFLGPNLDYKDWINYQPEKPKTNVVSFEEKREKARNESMDQQIAVSKWIQVTNRDPDENFIKWYEEGAKIDELASYVT